MFLRKLGKRGAEMVEYAIVLACIAAVGVTFYSSNDSNLTKVLDGLFGKVINVASLGSGVSPNGSPLTDDDKTALEGQTTIMYDSLTKFLTNKNLEDGFNHLVALELDDKGELKSLWYENGTGQLAQLTGQTLTDAKTNLNGNWSAMQPNDKAKYNTPLYANVDGTTYGNDKTAFVAYKNGGSVTGNVTGYSGAVFDSISGNTTNLWFCNKNNKNATVAQYIYSNQYGAFEKYPNGVTSSTN